MRGGVADIFPSLLCDGKIEAIAFVLVAQRERRCGGLIGQLAKHGDFRTEAHEFELHLAIGWSLDGGRCGRANDDFRFEVRGGRWRRGAEGKYFRAEGSISANQKEDGDAEKQHNGGFYASQGHRRMVKRNRASATGKVGREDRKSTRLNSSHSQI